MQQRLCYNGVCCMRMLSPLLPTHAIGLCCVESAALAFYARVRRLKRVYI